MADRDKVEKAEIVLPPGMSEEFFAAATAAGWSDDPGTGKAIIIDDPSREDYGAEILNPVPMAPPVGYEPGDTLEDMVARHMQKQFNLLGMKGDEEIDSQEDAEDFDIEDELPDLQSIYEVRELVEEVPDIGKPKEEAAEPPPPKEEAAKPPPPKEVKSGEGA